ncbi:MAG: hypothetical protein R2713_12105 [Ilumatobacteraceae bacterium]
MTRRLVVWMVGLVAATLVIAGLGTLVLANVRARTDTEQELRAQATTIAANLALFFVETDAPLDDQAVEQRLRQLTLLRRVVDLDGFAVVSPIRPRPRTSCRAGSTRSWSTSTASEPDTG